MPKSIGAAGAPQIPTNPFSDPVIAKRLAGHGVQNAEDWRRLGRARLMLFGITPRLIKALDAFARTAP